MPETAYVRQKRTPPRNTMEPTLQEYAAFAQAWSDPHAQIDCDKTYEINDKHPQPDSFVVVVKFTSWRHNHDATEVEVITADLHEETRFFKEETKKYILTDATDIACMHIMLDAICWRESDNDGMHRLLDHLVGAEMAADNPALFPELLMDSKDMEILHQEFTGDWRREFVRDCFNF
jgi:hypothetical protein